MDRRTFLLSAAVAPFVKPPQSPSPVSDATLTALGVLAPGSVVHIPNRVIFCNGVHWMEWTDDGVQTLDVWA